METDENALGGAAADVGGTGDCFRRGHWVEPGDDLYDAQAVDRQGRGHDGRQRKISEIQRSDHLF